MATVLQYFIQASFNQLENVYNNPYIIIVIILIILE